MYAIIHSCINASILWVDGIPRLPVDDGKLCSTVACLCCCSQVRQGLKEFSKWPTYPQFYSEGTLIGGLDILKEMAEDGELEAFK